MRANFLPALAVLPLLAALAQCLYLPIAAGPKIVTTVTPLGPAVGTYTSAGAVKYVVRYASTPVRWGAPVVEKVFLPAYVYSSSPLERKADGKQEHVRPLRHAPRLSARRLLTW